MAHVCENCKFRAHYDQKTNSALGRFWRWHINFCPGWRSYFSRQSEEKKAERLVEFLYDYFLKHYDELPEGYLVLVGEGKASRERAVCDYVSSMSDRYAIGVFNDLFLPNSWREM